MGTGKGAGAARAKARRPVPLEARCGQWSKVGTGAAGLGPGTGVCGQAGGDLGFGLEESRGGWLGLVGQPCGRRGLACRGPARPGDSAPPLPIPALGFPQTRPPRLKKEGIVPASY